MLTIVLLLGVAFALAPQFPLTRRLLRIPSEAPEKGAVDVVIPAGRKTRVAAPWSRAHAFDPAVALFTGPLVQVPDMPSTLMTAPLASNLTAAWAGALDTVSAPDKYVHPVQRQVIQARAEGVPVLNLLDPVDLAGWGIDLSVEGRDPSRLGELFDEAEARSAVGLLLPSRTVLGARELLLPAPRLDLFDNVQRDDVPLGLADVVSDETLRRLLSDEEGAQQFLTAVRSGGLDRWRAALLPRLGPAGEADVERLTALFSD